MKRIEKESARVGMSPLPPDAVSLALIRRAPVLRQGAPAQRRPPKHNSVGPRAPSAESRLERKKARRSGDTDVGPKFMRVDLPKILADARKRGHGAGFCALSTPITTRLEILKSYVRKDLNAADRAKLEALKTAGYSFEVSAELNEAGAHYWRLKVLVQSPI